jgi:hypothetical protein
MHLQPYPDYHCRNYDENNFHLITKHKQKYFQNSYLIYQIS